VIPTPVQAPNANAFAERRVCTVRTDCLDRILIVGRRQFKHVLRVSRVGQAAARVGPFAAASGVSCVDESLAQAVAYARFCL
jgi:hypothetical protein